MSRPWRNLLLVIITVLLLLGLSSIAIAESMPGMDMGENTTMTPSGEMAKSQARSQQDPYAEHPETKLDPEQQTTMIAIVAGLFFILPIGTWIIMHQRKRRRKSLGS